MSTGQIFLSAILAGALGGELLARRRRATGLEHACWIALPAGAITLALVAWSTFRFLPTMDWSANRLAASVRLAWGFPLYTPVHGAVINDWMYGPVAALAYTPAALAGDPLTALHIAAALNGIFFVLPAMLLFAPAVRAPATRLVAALGFVFCLGAHFAPFGTWYGAALLHVDTVAICLGVLSCLALVRGRRLTLAAVLCVLAVGAKQTELPLALAQIFFLARADGRRRALAYTARLAVIGAIVAAGFCAWFGAGTLWHNLVVIPSRYAIEFQRLGPQLGDLLIVTCWMWPVGWLAWKTRPTAAPTGDDQAGWLLVLAALVLLPSGLLAALKFGGGANSIHSVSYGMLGASFVGLQLASAARARIALLAGIAIVLAIDLERVLTFGHFDHPEPGRQHREAFEFARTHPGQAYFPWDTLATLMAERRDYPFDMGVADWRTAGEAPEAAVIRRALPETLAFVIYHERDQTEEMLRVLPEFNRRHAAGAWRIYTRAGPNAP
jgi:hypothetical protein